VIKSGSIWMDVGRFGPDRRDGRSRTCPDESRRCQERGVTAISCPLGTERIRTRTTRLPRSDAERVHAIYRQISAEHNPVIMHSGVLRALSPS
jgi:hypothetical protein